MTKDTQLFIKALKDKINELQDTNNDKSLRDIAIRDIAIDYLCEWSGCDRETYNESNLYDVVLIRFLDYLDTADKPSAVIRKYLAQKKWRGYIRDINDNYLKDETEVDDMLMTLALVQVRDSNGNYVNGFTKLIGT